MHGPLRDPVHALRQGDTVEYKGYTAWYEVDDEDGVWHGHVDGIDDVVTFESETFEGLEREFQISVDDYLEFCTELGCEPDRPHIERHRASTQ